MPHGVPAEAQEALRRCLEAQTFGPCGAFAAAEDGGVRALRDIAAGECFVLLDAVRFTRSSLATALPAGEQADVWQSALCVPNVDYTNDTEWRVQPHYSAFHMVEQIILLSL